MAVVARNKGQFVQAGMIITMAAPNGNLVNHDGTLALDTVYLQADYPVLFGLLGTHYNDPADNNATQFRTPTESDIGLPQLYDGVYRIRF